MAVNSFRRDEATNTAGKKETLVRLFAYLFRYKLQIAGVLLVMGTTIGISLINPLLIERAIDVYIKGKDLQGLLRLGMFTLLLNLVFVILIKVRMYVMAYITNKILLEIRQELYEHIQTL
ncbi:MAG: ABC transporter ATP-binding protein, partial [Acetivibrio ethanolgignens]